MENKHTCSTERLSLDNIHGIIHDISFAISKNELDKAKTMLREIDVITHEMIALETPIASDKGIKSPIRTFKEIWESRNPQHEENADTGKDMFWETAELVSKDFHSQLQPPVISAPDFLKEKYIAFQKENPLYNKWEKVDEKEIKFLLSIISEFLQRQGQKTNQTKL